METYVAITFPEIQDYMDLEGFDENAYLINDEHGINDFGCSAYFVRTEWLNQVRSEYWDIDEIVSVHQ